MTIASYAYMFKVRQVIVAFTGFDLVGLGSGANSTDTSGEAAFQSLEKAAREGLRKIGFREEQIIGCVPTSTAYGGLNILSSAGQLHMPWYQSRPSLVELIQRCKPVQRNREGPGILQVQKFVSVRGHGFARTIISGAVLRGKITCGELMVGVPSMEEVRFQSMEKFRTDVASASAGDTIGVLLNGSWRSYEIRSKFSGFLVSSSGKVHDACQILPLFGRFLTFSRNQESAIPPASSCFVLDAMFVKGRLGKRQKPLLGGAVTVTTRLGSVIGVVIKIEAILSPKNFQPIEVDASTISAFVSDIRCLLLPRPPTSFSSVVG
jgi:hypothetical protein